VEDIGIKAASKRVSDIAIRIAHAASLQEAQQYDPELREARQRAITLMHEALRNTVS
jgi:hypothetical protein